jgi:copper chaperone CopZ
METRVKIEGMHCDGCAGRVRRVLEKEAGVREVVVSFETGEARVDHDEQAVGMERIRELVQEAGYTVP